MKGAIRVVLVGVGASRPRSLRMRSASRLGVGLASPSAV
jgi:hypothetical protein